MTCYIVGIDLGTTNSAVAYVDTAEAERRIHLFPIAQFIAPGEVERRDTLPSFHYEPEEREFDLDTLRLPWEEHASSFLLGTLAKEQGAKNPARLICSAKSWLSHTGVDRADELLPWHGAANVRRHSPRAVHTRYLAHIQSAWNHEFPEHPLADQQIILTVPASYDEVARELTAEAATQAGLTNITLLEEPQAAFYDWLAEHQDDWQRTLFVGQTILVCDIGGGTTDFTLIKVDADQEQRLTLTRVRVGEHLILGGDNLDLTLAHHVENTLSESARLDVRQWSTLVRKCQSAKETLLSPSAPEEIVLSLPQAGSKLLQGAVHVTLKRDDARSMLVDGFLPCTDITDMPKTVKSGFQEFGLNYATDPAISRQLAAFLTQGNRAPVFPDILVFNGGFFHSPLLTDRLQRLLTTWSRQETGKTPVLLDNVRLDSAVAYGAAYYGLVKQGEGIRIQGGLPRSYYIAFENTRTPEKQAICLIPAGLTEGQTIDITSAQFTLRLRQPVEFPLYVSNCRPHDPPETIVPLNGSGLTPLPPLRTILTAGKKAKRREAVVRLHATLTEVGTLDVWCSDTRSEQTWKLQFNARASDSAEETPAVEQTTSFLTGTEVLQRCFQAIRSTFGDYTAHPDQIFGTLEQIAVIHRRAWPLSFLRDMWENLLEYETVRHLKPIYEARWLNMLGFCLRPGYGQNLDDWRVQQTWTLLMKKGVSHKRNQQCRAEWWILWRRIAGGLTQRHQDTLLKHCVPLLTDNKGRLTQKSSIGRHEMTEMLRLLGLLERVSAAAKRHLGNTLIENLVKKGIRKEHESTLWALGHLGTRSPMYGPLNRVVPVEVVEDWLRRVLQLPQWERQQTFPLVLLARKTGDRYRDISEELREDLLALLTNLETPSHYRVLVAEVGELDDDEQRLVVGESLPGGLKIL